MKQLKQAIRFLLAEEIRKTGGAKDGKTLGVRQGLEIAQQVIEAAFRVQPLIAETFGELAQKSFQSPDDASLEVKTARAKIINYVDGARQNIEAEKADNGIFW